MAKATQNATDRALTNSIPPHAAVPDAPMARRAFLAGLAVTLPAAAIAAAPVLATSGGDAELIALARKLSDLHPVKEAAADELERCENIHREMKTPYPIALLWRHDDPVPHGGDRYVTKHGKNRFWCSHAAIKKLRGRAPFKKWKFIGTAEERKKLSIDEFYSREIRPVLHYEHCFLESIDERKTARARELLAALDEHQAAVDAVYEQSGMRAAEEGYDEITDLMSDLFSRIRDLKAETLEGYRAKALAVVLNCWSGVIEPSEYEEESMLAAICSDLTGIPIKENDGDAAASSLRSSKESRA